MPDFAVIAGGPSVRKSEVEQLRHYQITTIAVNKAANNLPWVDYAFTLDCWNLAHRFNSFKLEHGKKIVALKPGFKHKLPDETEFVPRIPWQDTMDPLAIRTGNSAIGAYELAMKLGADRIFLFGCDCAEFGKHWYPNDIWKNKPSSLEIFSQTLPLWNKLMPVVETFNVSMISQIERFPKITFEECLCLLLPAS